MDKFVIRAPTWKTVNYDTTRASVSKQSATVSATQRREKRPLQAKVQRRPLQETADDNKSGPIEHRNEHIKELILKTQQNALNTLKMKTPVGNFTVLSDFGQLSESLTSTRIDDVDVAKTEIDINNAWKTDKDCQLPGTSATNKTMQQENINTFKAPAEVNPAKPDLPLRSDAITIRIHNDFNSPSAAMHLRAVRALCSKNDKVYQVFDVPHAEQSIITAEERNPPKPPNLNEILKDVIVYVEVRTGEDNRSEGVKKVIASMGAQVNDKLLRNTSHVVFKDGLLSTYKKARSWNIPVVSILWIEGCKNRLKLCDPTEFPISNLDQYENPELYPKMMRQRSMQPDSECNKRVRKPSTPTTTPECATVVPKNVKTIKSSALMLTTPESNKNDILKYFKTQSFDSPATRFLNKISASSMAPIQSAQKAIDSATPTAGDNIIGMGNGEQCNKEPTGSKNTPEIVQETAVLTAGDKFKKTEENTTPVRRIRRRSTVDLGKSIAVNASSPKGPVTRRRSSMHAVNSITTDGTTNMLKTNIPTISEEVPAKGTLTENIAQTDTCNATDYAQYTLETSDLANKSEQMNVKSVTKRNNSIRRHTIFSLQSMDISSISENDAQPKQHRQPHVTTTDDMDVCLTPIYSNVSSESRLSSLVEEEAAKTPQMFSSTRLPSSNHKKNRLTLHDVSMEIINQRLHSINESARRRSMTQLQEYSLPTSAFKCTPSNYHTPNPDDNENKKTAITSSSTSVKKRKLFVPNSEFVPPAETCDSSQKKHRQTMAACVAPAVKEGDCILADAPIAVKPAGAKKVISKRDARRSTLMFEQVPSHNAHDHADDTKKPDVVSAVMATADNAGQVVTAPSTADADLKSTIANKAIDLPETENNATTAQRKKKTISTLVYTNMRQEQVQVIRKAVEKLGGFKIKYTVDSNTTHLVSLEPRRTLNMLRGLMHGVWILQYKWILDSVRVNAWRREEHYEMHQFSRAVEICRAERQAFGKNYRCELFQHMESFYISTRCKSVPLSTVKELLQLGNANITEYRWRAKYIIGDKRREEDERIYLSSQWVLDSIEAMQVQRFSRYLMPSAIIAEPPAMFHVRQPTVGYVVRQTDYPTH